MSRPEPSDNGLLPETEAVMDFLLSLISVLWLVCISCGAFPLGNSRPFAESYVMENNSAK